MSLIFKNTQGMIVRLCSFLAASALAIFGIYRFYFYSFFANTPIADVSDFWRFIHKTHKGIGELWEVYTVPLISLEIPLSPRLGITLFLLAFFLILFFYLCFRHNYISEFLIDTESEMRKVAWPTVNEVTASSIVVIIVMFILGIYLYFVDIILASIFQWMFF
jgi:preprotein translocase SecE subunit